MKPISDANSLIVQEFRTAATPSKFPLIQQETSVAQSPSSPLPFSTFDFPTFDLRRFPSHPPQTHLPRPTPDPRFDSFILLQAQNAGLFLGQIPHPATGTKAVNLKAAQSVVDSLEMLAAKTTGNLTPTEQKLLDTALANLRPLLDTARAHYTE